MLQKCAKLLPRVQSATGARKCKKVLQTPRALQALQVFESAPSPTQGKNARSARERPKCSDSGGRGRVLQKCPKVLPSVRECYRVLQVLENVRKCCKRCACFRRSTCSQVFQVLLKAKMIEVQQNAPGAPKASGAAECCRNAPKCFQVLRSATGARKCSKVLQTLRAPQVLQVLKSAPSSTPCELARSAQRAPKRSKCDKVQQSAKQHRKSSKYDKVPQGVPSDTECYRVLQVLESARKCCTRCGCSKCSKC